MPSCALNQCIALSLGALECRAARLHCDAPSRPPTASCRRPRAHPLACLLQPGVWSEGEDDLLALWQSRVGNKWSEVAKHIPGAWRWYPRVLISS